MKKKLNMVALSQNELKTTKGRRDVSCRNGNIISTPAGGDCFCGCYYANHGGSSTSSNDSANTAGGLSSVPW